MELNNRERGAILAGLRAWQKLIVAPRPGTPAELYDLASNNGVLKPLSIAECAALFDKIAATKGEPS
jgi:hypothetical protein